ncbi:MAG: DUF2892 domain-containing protein [Phycisphaerales bacterium]
MKTNEGMADRAVRAIAGIAALVVAFMFLSAMDGAILGIVVAAVGVVLLITSLVGFCPAYRLVGISTCKVNPSA